MTIGIYAIEHVATGRRYIGKSIDIEKRFGVHKYNLVSKSRRKDTNRYLWSAVQKYGIDAFSFNVIETFATVDEIRISEAELNWMDFFDSCNRKFGFNLRRDSGTRMIVHQDTLDLMSLIFYGTANPNFGNKWTDSQKQRASAIQKLRHTAGIYGSGWRKQIGDRSSEFWKNNPEVKQRMANKVGEKRQRYNFCQCDKLGNELKRWGSIREIVDANPGYKWQNIYSVCNGYKPTYMNFIWKKVLINDTAR